MKTAGSSADDLARRDWVFAALPALLLIVVALHQIWLVHSDQLDPWKGGGFGMFSTTQGVNARHSHIFVTEGGEESEIEVPDDLEDEEYRLLSLPTDARFEVFAEELSEYLPDDTSEPASLRIELWFTEYDADLTPETSLVREFRREAARDAAR